MSTRKLERVGLDPLICDAFARNGVSTVGDLLLASPLALMLYADLSLVQVKEIVSLVSDKVQCKPTSALELLHKRAQTKRFLATGLNNLDSALKGGLLVGCISEISGPPGVGKTQFCLNCTLQTLAQRQLPAVSPVGGYSRPSSGGVIYFDTELKFDPNRLIQMAIERFPQLYSSEYRTDAPHQVDSLLSGVKIHRPTTCKQLNDEINQLQTVVISEGISLIIIDSIAALARKEALNERDKEAYFINQSAVLKKVSELCNCVVLATNQVTLASSSNPASLYNDAILDEHGAVYQPTLGPTWHHCVSLRLTMNTLSTATPGGDVRINPTVTLKQKYISITKSPISAPATMPFNVTSSGLTVPNI